MKHRCAVALIVSTLLPGACGDSAGATTIAGTSETSGTTGADATTTTGVETTGTTVGPTSSTTTAGTSSTSSSGAPTRTSTGPDTGSSTDAPTTGTTGVPTELHVLFIGNSYTAGNDLAGLVESLAAGVDGGPAVFAESVTMGGQTMAGHLGTPATLDEIASGAWDYVVLQGQSVEPTLPDNSEFIDAGIALSGHIADAGATPVLFETWARQEGHELYDQPWYGPDPAAAQAKLRDAYQLVTDSSPGAVMAPAGDAWQSVWEDEPGIVLYAGDGSHAALAGTYLAACVFLEVITGAAPPDSSWWPDNLDANTAATLQQHADVVLP